VAYVAERLRVVTNLQIPNKVISILMSLLSCNLVLNSLLYMELNEAIWKDIADAVTNVTNTSPSIWINLYDPCRKIENRVP
jgi:hypothetical protein